MRKINIKKICNCVKIIIKHSYVMYVVLLHIAYKIVYILFKVIVFLYLECDSNLIF